MRKTPGAANTSEEQASCSPAWHESLYSARMEDHRATETLVKGKAGEHASGNSQIQMLLDVPWKPALGYVPRNPF